MRKGLLCSVVAIAAAILLAVPAQAQLSSYSQDFEDLLDTSLDQPDQVELANDGWNGFVNVFNPGGGFIYNYGFPAPNGGFGGPAISAVIVGEGGLEQGMQQLTIFSDYNNGDHAFGNLIETNVFQEQVVGPMDVGTTWLFQFDSKRGNVEGATTAAAFIKTLDPNAGFALTNFLTADMTDIGIPWNTSIISIYIDPSLVGQILQFGFINTASNYEGSGVFYDNVIWGRSGDVCGPVDDEDEDGDEESDGNYEFFNTDDDMFDDSIQGQDRRMDLMGHR